MIWFTWRQFRGQLLVAVGLLAAVAVTAAVGRNIISGQYADSGLATCNSNCDQLLSTFLDNLSRTAAGVIFYVGLAAVYLAPGLIGVFWGAPMVSRELETGTYRLAWNQSVTRTRWLLVKLIGIGGASVAITGLLSLAVTWSASVVDHAQANRLGPLLFAARGVVPLGYAAFAYTLGVALGMVIRRTIPAMAATLAVYIGVVAAMPLWVRGHLTPIRHATPPLDMDKLDGISIHGDGLVHVAGRDGVPGAWVLSNDTIDATGATFTGAGGAAHCAGPDTSPKQCLDWVGTLHLRQNLYYHSPDQYWTMQWAETGLFVGLAVALAGFSLWWLRRKMV
jgi:hypothetical protein